MTALISVKNLSVRHSDLPILSDVSFDVSRKEIVTIVGPNGSGKSTLIKALLGIIQPSSGHVRRDENLRVGYVPQTLNIDGTLPIAVGRFLSLGAKSGGVNQDFDTYLGMQALLDVPMAALSGGQFQRVLLARAVRNRPDILVLDEATRGLDQNGAADFYRLVELMRDRLGCAVVMVSHDLHVVMAASDRVLCLNGHVCCEGAPEQVATAPEYRALFGTGTQGALALYRHDHNHNHHDHSGC